MHAGKCIAHPAQLPLTELARRGHPAQLPLTELARRGYIDEFDYMIMDLLLNLVI